MDLRKKFRVSPEKLLSTILLSLFREQAQVIGKPARGPVFRCFGSSHLQIDVYSSGDGGEKSPTAGLSRSSSGNPSSRRIRPRIRYWCPVRADQSTSPNCHLICTPQL